MCVVLEPFVGALSYYPDPSTVVAERPKHAGVPTSSRAEHHSVCRIYHCLQFGRRDPSSDGSPALLDRWTDYLHADIDPIE